MGMASLVLWWMDNPAASRQAIVDAMTRVWAGASDRRAASQASGTPGCGSPTDGGACPGLTRSSILV